MKKDSGLLEKEVEEKGKNLDYGSAFITSSYGLPAQYIIHVIAPFRNSDIDHLNKLKNTYLSILNLALKMAYNPYFFQQSAQKLMTMKIQKFLASSKKLAVTLLKNILK